MKIEPDKYYTIGEAIESTMATLGISREEAAEMIWGGINSGELPTGKPKSKGLWGRMRDYGRRQNQ